MTNYRLYETRSQGFQVERSRGREQRALEWINIGQYREPWSSSLSVFMELIREDERRCQLVWTQEFLLLRLRCAEALGP